MEPGLKHIILVDDHVIVRDGLRELVERLGPYKVIGGYDSGKRFLDDLPLDPSPDLVIMDVYMPDMNGDLVMELMAQNQVRIPVLVLTLNEDETLVIKLFRLGARGYLKKNCSAAELKTALEEVFSRGYYHNEFLAFSLQTSAIQGKKTDQEKILEQMSPREREFLKLVCHENEYTYEQMADIMGVQPRTVDGYRESVFQKFGIRSKTGLVLFVLKYNLIGLL